MDENDQQNELFFDLRKLKPAWFIVAFSVIFFFSFSILFLIEKEAKRAEFEQLMVNEKYVVAMQDEILRSRFSAILSDLGYLHHAFGKQLDNPANYASITANWATFSTERNIYDQIRYLDVNGDEKIRIDLGKSGGYPVPAATLQNKKDRYYFFETIKLKEETIHISPLDLNIERGEIELPHKPMMRFSTPIYDHNGKPNGVIVLNYLAEQLLNEFRSLAYYSRGEITLLNSDSYWLSRPDRAEEWNFMFPDRQDRSFKKVFDREWAAILRSDGQLVTANGLFTFSPVSLTHDDTKTPPKAQLIFTKENWYIVSAIAKQGPNKALFADNTVDLLIDVLKKNTFEITMMTISSLIMALLLYLTRSSYSKIKYQSEYDALTKVYNRRAGLSKIEQLCPFYNKKCATVISICFIDINGLKQVNDVLGHHFGDELIQTSVAVMKSVIREQDFVIRLGGDEFLIVFNNTNEAMAEKIWQRINQEFDKINETENRPYVISLSHGLVCQQNAQKNIVDDLIKIADEKMYSEKQLIKQNLQIIRSTDTKIPPV